MSKKRPGPLLKLSNHEDKPHDEHDHEKEKKIPDRIIQVAPKLYLSGAKAASNFEELLLNRINVIVSLIPTKNMKVYPDTFQYIDSPISDHVDQDISHLIIDLPMKIHDLVLQGKHVLVHCQEVACPKPGHFSCSFDPHRLPDVSERQRLRVQPQLHQSLLAEGRP